MIGNDDMRTKSRLKRTRERRIRDKAKQNNKKEKKERIRHQLEIKIEDKARGMKQDERDKSQKWTIGKTKKGITKDDE